MTMTKFQYMVLIVAAIFIVLVLIIFGIFVKMSFSQKKIKKKRAPCPDYWEEVKNVSVVDVYPNKEYIYKNNSPFTTTSDEKIGNNDVQGIQIRIDKDTPFIRILNENPKTITACKVPANGATNVGSIYDTDNTLKIRNFRYGAETNRKNYTTIDKIPATGTSAPVAYDKKNDYYSIDPNNTALVNAGDSINIDKVIKTPGFYWDTACINADTACHNGTDNGNIKIWGNNSYTPSNFYIDFTDNDWHAINMNKSQLCNLKDWANRNNIVWDGVTNIAC